MPAPTGVMSMSGSVSLGIRCRASVTMEMLDDRFTTVSTQKTGVRRAWRTVKSGSSSSELVAREDAALASVSGGSPSGLRP